MVQIILIIHANADYAAELQQHIQKQMKLETQCMTSGEEALRAMADGTIPQPDVVLYTLEKTSSAPDTIREMRRFRNDMQIVTILDHTQTELAVKTMAYGAVDFLLAPFHAAQLTATIRNALARRDLQIEARQAWAGERIILEDMVAQSTALKVVLAKAKTLAQTATPLVLKGAAGSGREMLARAMHNSSPRKHYPFITLNASLLSPDDASDRFFGDGSALAKAQNGTLFIRNIDSLPQAVLQKLLEQVKEGGAVHVRLLLAVNAAVKKSDNAEENNMLLALLDMVQLPSLSDIPEDIVALALTHCRRYAAYEGKAVTGISPAACQMLRNAPWPGNIEQLSQNVFRAVMQCKGHELQVEDFSHLYRSHHAEVTYLPKKGTTLQTRIDGLLKYVDDKGHIKRLQDVEETIIRYALKHYKGHMTDIARHLGIGRSTLYRKISAMGMEVAAIAPAQTRRHGQ